MIELGYNDAHARAAEIRDFLQVTHARKYRSTVSARNRDA
jgi:hypothetical protein